MSDQNRKLSRLSLAGFILSVITPVLLVLNQCFSWQLSEEFYWIVLFVIVLLPLAGLILSIVGLITAVKKGRKGKGFAIAGIVIPVEFAVLITALVILYGAFAISSIYSTNTEEKYPMHGAGYESNTDYDVSAYRLTKDTNLDSMSVNVTKAELKEYVKGKLQTIDYKSDKNIRGTYKGQDFDIVRIDCYSKWRNENGLTRETYTYEGYVMIGYITSTGFDLTSYAYLDVYKDPSGKFLIVTNCRDYRVISEFFEN